MRLQLIKNSIQKKNNDMVKHAVDDIILHKNNKSIAEDKVQENIDYEID